MLFTCMSGSCSYLLLILEEKQAYLDKILFWLILNERQPPWSLSDSSDKSPHQTFKPGGTCTAVSPCPCFDCKQIRDTSCTSDVLLTPAASEKCQQCHLVSVLKGQSYCDQRHSGVKLWETVLSVLTFHFKKLSRLKSVSISITSMYYIKSLC